MLEVVHDYKLIISELFIFNSSQYEPLSINGIGNKHKAGKCAIDDK